MVLADGVWVTTTVWATVTVEAAHVCCWVVVAVTTEAFEDSETGAEDEAFVDETKVEDEACWDVDVLNLADEEDEDGAKHPLAVNPTFTHLSWPVTGAV